MGEAAGANEAEAGAGFVGKAGQFLFGQLSRVGVEREVFRLANVLSCQPPNNKLVGEAYETSVIASCAPLLDTEIAATRARALAAGKTPVILTMGKTAFKRVMGYTDKSPEMGSKVSSIGYPFWSETYQAWVVPSHHPSYLMRGNLHLVPTLQFAAKRALEISEKGMAFEEPPYLLDPPPEVFKCWVREYLRRAATEDLYLSYDIETPMKQGQDESEVELPEEELDDHVILRCSFAYQPGDAVSVPWNAAYMPLLQEIFAAPYTKIGWNSDLFDKTRVLHYMPVNGLHLDVMLAWHVLNSGLPKGLGFVTPFYWQNRALWKHEAFARPAYYNAVDADAALRNWLGIVPDLKTYGLWPVFDRHVIQLNQVLGYMSAKGVLRDEAARTAAEERLTTMLRGVEARILAAVPEPLRRQKIYARTPKSTDGLVQVTARTLVKRCGNCGVVSPTQHHRRVLKKSPNPCAGADVVVATESVERWATPPEFKLSSKSLGAYLKAKGHRPVIDRRKGSATFDEDAIKKLMERHPGDGLYPLVLEQRKIVKIRGVYVGAMVKGRLKGGMPIGDDGRIHTNFTHNPSTLRLASNSPNMQNLPRPRKEQDLETIVRNLIIAAPGHTLTEFDFAAIEALLVGWFAMDPSYIRLSKMGIHSYLASHVLGRPADLSWSDADLIAYFGAIKHDKSVADIYLGCKRAIHLSGYGGSPKKMVMAEPEVFKTLREAERLQGMYFDLFPAVRRWQQSCQLQAEKDGFLRNPWGYIHRFSHVFSYEKVGGAWVKKPGEDANKVLAFLPQSSAAAAIKDVMLRLYQDHFDEAGQYLRLQVHDSLVSEVPDDKLSSAMAIIHAEMTKPIPELALPPAYGMGDHLTIGVDSKVGQRWGSLA